MPRGHKPVTDCRLTELTMVRFLSIHRIATAIFLRRRLRSRFHDQTDGTSSTHDVPRSTTVRRAEPEGPLSSATRLGQELAADDSTTLRGSSLKNHLDERMTSKFVRFINHTSSHQREFSSGSMMFPKPGPSSHQKPVDSFRRNLPAKIRKEGPAKIIRQQVLGLQLWGLLTQRRYCATSAWSAVSFCHVVQSQRTVRPPAECKSSIVDPTILPSCTCT